MLIFREKHMTEADLVLRNCKLKKRCNKTWGELSKSSPSGMLKNLRIDTVRYCKDCKELVWRCDTKDELVEAILKNHCVAFRDWNETFSGQMNKPLLGSIKIYD